MGIKRTIDQSSGYTFDPYIGAALHFSHIAIEWADKLLAPKESAYIVEAVNHTLAENKSCIHFNKYYALNFKEALCIAMRIEVASDIVAEEVVGIRPATQGEIEFLGGIHNSISDKELEVIPDN